MKDMKDRNIIRQDYKLINARYKLNTNEIKFILLAISQIDAIDDSFEEYSIKVSDLENKFKVEQNETRLKNLAKKLMSKPLEIPTNNGWIIVNWFSQIRYIKNEAKFFVKIDNDLKPFLLDLRQRFIKYNINNIIQLKSKYAIRIYQLLKEYEKIKNRIIKLSELQNILQVPNSLIKFADFKRKVLNVAKRQINENTDIVFDFKTKKTGRKITHLIFEIKSKTKNKKENNQILFKDKKICINEKIFYIHDLRKNNDIKDENYNKYVLILKDKLTNNPDHIYKVQLQNVDLDIAIDVVKRMLSDCE